MYNHILYFLFWVINIAVLYFFGLLFPNSVVLANYRFSPLESAIYAGFWVVFITWIFWDFGIARKLQFENTIVRWGYFFMVNAFSFWIVSKFAQYIGFGIFHYYVTFALGGIALIFQSMVWALILKKK